MTRRELDVLLDEALDRDPSEWPSFLDAACDGDTALRRELESLLAMHVAYPNALTPGPSAAAALPASIGRYRIHREIARGGMGVVYEASDDTLDRRVALKVLPARLAGDPEWRRRFGREARHLAAMEHPNVANVHTLEATDGLHFLTMDLLDGEPLAERLTRGRLSLPVALAVALGIARALEAVHRKGIVHCDLKPSNVLLSEDARVTVIDFGLARHTASAATGRDVSTRTGTPGYMAPEQIEGLSIDHRVDIWAFGCVFYECLSGVPAFPGTPEQRLSGTLAGTPDWGRLPPALPEPLRDLLLRALKRSVDARLDDMTTFRRAIENASAAPPSTVDAPEAHPPGNLPRWPNAFVGRREEVAALAHRLTSTRLLTLTGAAGSGKTRLATHVGHACLPRYADGVWFVDLRTLDRDELLPQSIATVLDVPVDPTRSLLDAVSEALQRKRSLLILDNCEHRLDACRHTIQILLDRCDGIDVLATSRRPLRTEAEFVHVVTPLARPDPTVTWRPEDLSEVPSVRLFLARARESCASFQLTADNTSSVAALCHRLEGLPLAIELVASHADAFAMTDMAASVAASLASRTHSRVGGGDGALDAFIRWSFDLLEPDERHLFQRLSVFRGGWTLRAAERVCGDGVPDATPIATPIATLLTRLRDQSLVQFDVGARPIGGDVRFRMLEPIRTFAANTISTNEKADLGASHARAFAALAEEAAPHLKGENQVAWLSTLSLEHDNLRAALDHAIESDADPLLGLRLVYALELFWTLHGHWSEGIRYSDAALARPDASPATELRGHALNTAALFHLSTGSPETADRLYDEALAIGKARDDISLIARSTHNKGGVALNMGRWAEAKSWFEAYLAIQRERGDRDAQAKVLSNLGVVADREGRLEDARALYEEALHTLEGLDDQRMRAVLLNNLGAVAFTLGDLTRARDHLEAGLVIHRDAEDPWSIANALDLLGAVAEGEGNIPSAARHFRDSLDLLVDIGDLAGVCRLLTQIGLFAVRCGRAATGTTLLGHVEALRERIKAPTPPSYRSQVEDARAAARQALGEDAFASRWREGAALATERAVALALTVDGSSTDPSVA